MKKLLAILLVLCMVLSVAACGSKEAAKPAETTTETKTETAEETLKDKAAKFDRKSQFLTVGTGPTSGIYFPIGGAFATALKDYGYQTSAEATNATGSVFADGRSRVAGFAGKGLQCATEGIASQNIEYGHGNLHSFIWNNF